LVNIAKLTVWRYYPVEVKQALGPSHALWQKAKAKEERVVGQ